MQTPSGHLVSLHSEYALMMLLIEVCLISLGISKHFFKKF